MIVLDTDVLVKLLGPTPNTAIVDHLRQYSSEEWTLPSLVAFEFYRSCDSRAEMTRTQRRLGETLDRILPFTDESALEAAYLDERLRSQSVRLDIVDLLNLATAHTAGGTFVTHNKNDFDTGPLHALCDVDIVYTDS